ncbi:MAG: CDP-alcohol phosphatidyltransferase family protein [Deltaproteobacteria bacterium]
MNIPNLLTLLRILLIPLLVIFLMDGKKDYAFIVFISAAVSDGLDGFIARVFRQKTQFGAYIDPIADKLLIGTSFVTLAILNFMPGWLAVVVISRDIIILCGLGLLLLNNRPINIRPLFDSKLTTLLQLLLVAYFLSYDYQALSFIHPAESYLIFITAAVTVFSGFHYIVLGFSILGNSINNGVASKQ